MDPVPPVRVAKLLLEANVDGFEVLRIHQFVDDLEAHDDEWQDSLMAEFSAEFERVQMDLSMHYGTPLQSGSVESSNLRSFIPLCGIFRYAIWQTGGKLLYAVAAHEDREPPFLLMLGVATTSGK